MQQKPPRPSNPDADAIAVAALSFLASEPERLGRFLSITGLGPQNLRESARQPAFLGQVLAYLCGDEALLITFAESAGLPPHAVAAAYERLAGSASNTFM